MDDIDKLKQEVDDYFESQEKESNDNPIEQLKQFCNRTFSNLTFQNNNSRTLILKTKRLWIIHISTIIIVGFFPIMGLVKGIDMASEMLSLFFLLILLVLLYFDTKSLNKIIIDLEAKSIKILNISILQFLHTNKKVSFSEISEIYSKNFYKKEYNIKIKTRFKKYNLLRINSFFSDSDLLAKILSQLIDEYKLEKRHTTHGIKHKGFSR